MIIGKAPNVIARRSLLKAQKVMVSIDGEYVLFTVGNSTLTMHYEDALQISQWIRVRAKEAKHKAGDTSRHWSALATLDGLRG